MPIFRLPHSNLPPSKIFVYFDFRKESPIYAINGNFALRLIAIFVNSFFL